VYTFLMPAELHDFSADIRRVLRRARDNAIEHGDHAVEPVHLLYGLATLPHSRAAEILMDLGANIADLQLLSGGPIHHIAESKTTPPRGVIRRLFKRSPAADTPPQPHADVPYSPHSARTLQLTVEEYQRRGDRECDTDHLLLALLALGDDRAGSLLLSAGVTLDRARAAVQRARA
jgi:ATP-dependent Clp protease ATP-binding subunit ClpA